jgi:tripartite ATP-independent transporter DctM subunit
MDPKITLFGSFFFLIIMKVPIGFALAISSLLTVIHLKINPLIVLQRMVSGINSYMLLAIPFFILAGNVMAEGGIARRIVELAKLLVGRIPGGQAMVNVVDSMFFGGISGSAVADVAATGSIDIPMMLAAGYDRGFAVALTVAASIQGIIIPPSHNAVIYSMAAGGVSIGALFMAGYIPGILLGVALMIDCYIIAKRRGYPTFPFPRDWRKIFRVLWEGLLGLLTGAIIIGGIVSGIFTPTESGAIGALYSILISAVVYRELTWSGFKRAVLSSVHTVGSVMFIIASASAFGWLLAYLRVPGLATKAILSVTTNRVLGLLLINILLLLLGMIMDMAPLIIIVTPILLPVVQAYGMHPVHFGVVLLLNLGIGLLTPPVGTALFTGCAVGKVSLEEVTKNLIYFLPAMIIVLLIITFWPTLVLFLPRLLGLIK